MINIKIYDYQNNVYSIPLEENDIDFIVVTVVSGDEIIHVYNKNSNSPIIYDRTSRIYNIYDGSYVVMASHINDWQEVVNIIDADDTISYQRMRDWR